jgi:hypothetical protein
LANLDTDYIIAECVGKSGIGVVRLICSPHAAGLSLDDRLEKVVTTLMVQHNRLHLRIFLLLVLAVGFFGAWYTSQQIPLESITLPSLQDSTDWFDFFAIIGEETIQLLLGMTSGQ